MAYQFIGAIANIPLALAYYELEYKNCSDFPLLKLKCKLLS